MRSEALLNNLNLIAIISETDVQGRIIFANDLLLKISGYSREELIGQDHRLLNSGYHSKEFIRDMWETILRGDLWKGEVLNKKKNGDFYWVDSIIFPHFNDENKIIGFFSIRYDITEAKRLKDEEAIQKKMRSIGESTAQILHDIMTPMMLIESNLKNLHKKLEIDHVVDQVDLSNRLHKMEGSSKKIVDICKNMQTLLHGNNDSQRINISTEAFNTKVYLAEKLSLKNIVLEVVEDVVNEECVVLGNIVQIQQVIINLVNNSIDAIENNPDKWIKIVVNHDENHVYLSVIDSGLGIDPKIQPKLFHAMFSTKELYKGTGLGLGICKKIIESFGGTIVINNDSPNTRFDIKLPKAKK